MQLNIFFFDLARNVGMRRNFAELKVNNQHRLPPSSRLLDLIKKTQICLRIFINKSKATKKHPIKDLRHASKFKSSLDLFTFERLD